MYLCVSPLDSAVVADDFLLSLDCGGAMLCCALSFFAPRYRTDGSRRFPRCLGAVNVFGDRRCPATFNRSSTRLFPISHLLTATPHLLERVLCDAVPCSEFHASVGGVSRSFVSCLFFVHPTRVFCNPQRSGRGISVTMVRFVRLA